MGASGGKLTAAYWQALTQTLERTIEAIELTTELHAESKGDGDDWDELFNG